MKLVILSFCLVLSGPAALRAAEGSQVFQRDYSNNPAWFPDLFSPYRPEAVGLPVMENSPRLQELIHNGKLEVSLADALALAVENNLDIGVQRYLRPIAQADVLRTRSGQAARGITGALVPAGLSVGAIGVGVNQSAGTGGVGAAGGITGGGGAIQVGQTGTFDPSLTLNGSWDRTVAPLNTVQVAGVPTVATYSTALSGTYTQLFPDGLSYFATLNGLRQSSTQQFLRYNPAVISRFASGFNQPLLNGRGLVPNRRFLMVALNNLKLSEDLFRLQVTTVIVQVENAYWDLRAARESVRVAEKSLSVSRLLYENNQKQERVGTLAHLDVITAQSQVASAARDLVLAQTNLQLAETRFKNLLSKRTDPDLDAAGVVTVDPLPEPREGDVPDSDKAIRDAVAHRPELRQAQNDLRNQEIAIQFTQNALLPQASVFGLFAGSGLQGNSLIATGGAGGSLQESFSAAYPEYGSGLSLFLFLRNRSARADYLRAQLEAGQLQVTLQRSRQQIALEVRQAITGLIQGRAQVAAAHEAAVLADQVLDAEHKKFALGVSSTYEVILRERDQLAAQMAEIDALDSYAKALVEIDRAAGQTLEQNGIELSDALSGTVSRRPTPPVRLPLGARAQPRTQ